jgi:beta-1,4-mannosyl-glycoprotein beta-1,4-N-acetylglucosaminyltransferase
MITKPKGLAKIWREVKKLFRQLKNAFRDSDSLGTIARDIKHTREEIDQLRSVAYTNRYLLTHRHEECSHSQRKIWDCFGFFNELDILEIRLNTLDPIVDQFVLVEATRTHSNLPKPLYFEENKDRFAHFLPKIKHIIVEEYPLYETSWTYENYQRNCMIRGLKDCAFNDIVIISDVDEIPNPETVLKCKDMPGIKTLQQKFYNYYLNCQIQNERIWNQGTKVLSFYDFLTWYEHHVFNYNEYCLRNANNGTTPTLIRMTQGTLIENGGWHFSYLGGIEKVKEKIMAFAHQELNTAQVTNNITKSITSGKDAIRQGDFLQTVELDNTFPLYILENQEKFSHLIKND